MRKYLYTFLLVVFFIFNMPFISHAQLVQKQHPSVLQQGVSLNLAWLGGLNSPQFSSVDANNDNILDLFVFERTSEQIFILTCQANGAFLERNESQEANIPKLSVWAFLKDYNCDNLPDIFTYGSGSIQVYLNTGTASNWSFKLVTTDLQSFSDFGSASYFSSIYASPVDLPLIEDLDDDGDLDIFSFGVSGERIAYHKNLSMEFNGTCDSLHFALKNSCWAYIAEDEIDNTLLLGSNDCPINVVNPERRRVFPTLNEYPLKSFIHKRHGGSSIALINKTDSLSELVLGDVSYPSLAKFDIVKNQQGKDSARAVFYDFPTTHSVNLQTFPAAYLINRAGLNTEMIVSPFALSGTANVESVWRYTKTGTEWEFQESNFIQHEMIDLGENTYPIWHDMNNDGVVDLLVGNGNRYTTKNEFGSLAVFINEGTDINPAFNLVENDFLQLQSNELENLYPAFGDLTGDGRDELLVGTQDGFMLYYTNNADVTETFTLTAIQLEDENNTIIDVGTYATPCLIDINQDLLLDLIIGNRNGKLTYYKNTGTSNTPKFTFITNNYANINVTPSSSINGHSTPKSMTLNNTTVLVVGNEDGDLFWYDELTETSAKVNLDFPKNLNTGKRSSIALNTINNACNLVIGNTGGGLNYFQLNTDLLSVNSTDSNQKISLFPNPVSDEISINGITDASICFIRNMQGTLIQTSSLNTHLNKINLAHLSNGVYTLTIQNKTSVSTLKFIKQ